MTTTTFVTGALGCIGAWVVKALLERGDEAFVFDVSDDARRLRDLVTEDAFARVRFRIGDITDPDDVRAALAESGATRVIHLAGLQVPFCKQDPGRGARVNVAGTIHVFQAALELGIPRVVYASSAAVYGAEDGDHPDEDAVCRPATHYGAFKLANERNARVFFQDNGLSSVGLRPLTVYGVGRDQGLTSGPTTALKAAVLGREHTIAFSGRTDFNYVEDASATFLAAADSTLEGAHVFNLHGDSIDVRRFVELIEAELPEARGRLHVDGPPLPLPPSLAGERLRAALGGLRTTSLEEGIARTAARFRTLADVGRLDTRDLDA